MGSVGIQLREHPELFESLSDSHQNDMRDSHTSCQVNTAGAVGVTSGDFLLKSEHGYVACLEAMTSGREGGGIGTW